MTRRDGTTNEEWLCKTCKGPDGLPLHNDGRRKECRRCHLSKGSCFKGKVAHATPSVSRKRTQGTQLQRPGTRKSQAAGGVSDTEAKLRQQLASLTAECKQLKAQRSVPADPAMELDHDGTDAANAALQADIELARKELRVVQQCDDHLKALIPGYDNQLAAAKAKLEAAMAAKRAANPLRLQMEDAENYQGRLTKKVADAKLAIDTKREEVAKAQTALQEQEAALAELQAALAKADSQIAELATRLASEHTAAMPTPPAAGRTEPGDSAPEGYISLAEATTRWNEFMAKIEQEREGEREQLNKLLSDPRLQHPAANNASASASETTDLDALEDLETNDEAWSKVDRGKRKAILNHSRDKMAKDLHAGISRVIKASKKTCTATSPFKK